MRRTCEQQEVTESVSCHWWSEHCCSESTRKSTVPQAQSTLVRASLDNPAAVKGAAVVGEGVASAAVAGKGAASAAVTGKGAAFAAVGVVVVAGKTAAAVSAVVVVTVDELAVAVEAAGVPGVDVGVVVAPVSVGVGTVGLSAVPAAGAGAVAWSAAAGAGSVDAVGEGGGPNVGAVDVECRLSGSWSAEPPDCSAALVLCSTTACGAADPDPWALKC